MTTTAERSTKNGPVTHTLTRGHIRPGDWLCITKPTDDGRLCIVGTERSSYHQTAYVVDTHDTINQCRYRTAFIDMDHAAAWFDQVANPTILPDFPAARWTDAIDALEAALALIRSCTDDTWDDEQWETIESLHEFAATR